MWANFNYKRKSEDPEKIRFAKDRDSQRFYGTFARELNSYERYENPEKIRLTNGSDWGRHYGTFRNELKARDESRLKQIRSQFYPSYPRVDTTRATQEYSSQRYKHFPRRDDTRVATYEPIAEILPLVEHQSAPHSYRTFNRDAYTRKPEKAKSELGRNVPHYGQHSHSSSYGRTSLGGMGKHKSGKHLQSKVESLKRPVPQPDWSDIFPPDPVVEPNFLPEKDLRFLKKLGYKFGKKLSSGSFGQIVECWYEQGIVDHNDPNNFYIDRQALVCKKVSVNGNQGLTDDEAMQLLNAEKVALMCAKHRNVIDVHNVWSNFESERATHAMYTLFFMERADGDLWEYLNDVEQQTGQPLGEYEIRLWFRQILTGVEYLHSINIAHRDLKTENVLYLKRPSPFPFVAKLTDFGYAHIAGQSGRNTMAHQNYGTENFKALEVEACAFDANARYDPFKADVYSLGMTLSYMFTFFEYVMFLRGSVPNVPKYVFISQQVYDLIHLMIESNLSFRVTLNRIKTHPWMTVCLN